MAFQVLMSFSMRQTRHRRATKMKRLSLLLLFILLGTTLGFANNTKPKAVISNSLGTYVIEPGQTITFDGRASYDLDGGGIAAYRWYENGSGSHSSTSPTFVKTYYSYGTFALKLRVTDHENTYDEKTVTIQVRPSVAGTKYYITDHLGSVRSTVASVNGQAVVVGQEDFWSYGLTMPGRSWNNGNAYDRYKFTGHERDTEGGLDWDYMIARNYDPEIGRFMGVDPLFAKYPGLSPYMYVGGNPIRAVDPDGRAIVFINGFHLGPFGGANRGYWGSSANQISGMFPSENIYFFDGEGMSSSHRQASGYLAGLSNASLIIGLMAPTESLKIITHSMGAAYARGFIRGLQSYVSMFNAKTGMSLQMPTTFLFDLDGFQTSRLKTMDNINTFEISGEMKEMNRLFLNMFGGTGSADENTTKINEENEDERGHALSYYIDILFKYLDENNLDQIRVDVKSDD